MACLVVVTSPLLVWFLSGFDIQNSSYCISDFHAHRVAGETPRTQVVIAEFTCSRGTRYLTFHYEFHTFVDQHNLVQIELYATDTKPSIKCELTDAYDVPSTIIAVTTFKCGDATIGLAGVVNPPYGQPAPSNYSIKDSSKKIFLVADPVIVNNIGEYQVAVTYLVHLAGNDYVLQHAAFTIHDSKLIRDSIILGDGPG